MNAEEVITALRSRFNTERYLTLTEVPLKADRSGTRADLVAVGVWKSTRFEIDVVEVKVSVGDWRRELASMWKSAEWRRHSHRFWVAAPVSLAVRIRDEAPAGWGVIAVDGRGCQTLTKPVKNEQPDPLPWQGIVGMLRTAVDAGPGARARAFEAGARAAWDQVDHDGPREVHQLKGHPLR